MSQRQQQRQESLARQRRATRISRALVGLVGLLAAAGLTAAIVSHRHQPFRRGSPRFSSCSVRLVLAQCARVAVPRDPRRPGGPRTWLHIALIPATHRPKGALFYLAGGPGDAASDAVPAADQLLGQVAAERDIVLVDQRGTGGSGRLSCGAGRVRADDDAALAAYARRCFARLGDQTRLLTTAVAADDLEAVRRALGYGRIDLYGVSYGATAAQVYLALHPSSVRSAVLDSGSLVQVPLYRGAAANAERALRALLAGCMAQPACRRAFPHPRGDLATLLAHPPGRVDTPTGSVRLDADAVAATVRALSLAQDGLPELPSLLHAAARGEPLGLAEEFQTRVGSELDPRARLAMAFEILCSEPWARQVAGSARGSYLAAFERHRAARFRRACRGVPRGIVPPRGFAPAPARAPVLLLAGALDPQDPPASLLGWRRRFPDGRLLVVPRATHGTLADGCVPRLVVRFVDTGGARGLDAACLQQLPPLRFDLSG